MASAGDEATMKADAGTCASTGARPDIVTPRLLLRLLDVHFLDACLRERFDLAQTLLGAPVPAEWRTETRFMAWRWQQLREDPGYAPFGPRALLARSPLTHLAGGAASSDAGPIMIGHIGFHTSPGADYLSARGPRAIEVGYSVFEAWRRQGYAEEAVRALLHWASVEHRVLTFIASISPTNQPSLRLAAKLGFTKVGEQMDDIDGPEDVFAWTPNT